MFCPLVMGKRQIERVRERCPLTLADVCDLHVFLCCSTCHVAVKVLWLDWSAAVHVYKVEARRVALVFVRLTRLLVDRWVAEQRYGVTERLQYSVFFCCLYFLCKYIYYIY